MKGWRSLWVLAFMAVGVLTLVWWDQRRPSTEQAAQLREQLMPGFRREEVRRIAIIRGATCIALVRAGEIWTLEGGIRADQDAIDALLSEIELGRVGRTVGRADAQLRKTLGLDPPRLTLELGAARIELGADAPGGVYFQRGDEVYVADRRLYEMAARGEWRSRRITLTNVGAAKTLSIGGTRLARVDRGWTVGGAPADAKAVDQLLDAIDGARAIRFAAVPTGGEPLVVNGTVEARLVDDCATRADGAQLCFEDLSRLRVDPARLRERRLYPFSAGAVIAVDLIEGDRALSLRRQAGIWRIVAPLEAAGPADDPSVQSWLKELVAREEEGGQQILTLRTAEVAATHRVRDQPLDPLRFRDRRVVDLRPDEVARVEIREGGHSYAVVREHHGAQGDTFRTDPPSNADEDALARLVETFARLRADRFLRAPLGPPERILRANGHELSLTEDCRGAAGGLTFTLQPSDCKALLVKE